MDKDTKHELYHARINLKYWNMLVTEINYLEREWCKMRKQYEEEREKLKTDIKNHNKS